MTILRNVPLEDYLSQADFCSHSRLRDFCERGPRFFYDRYIARILEREETRDLAFGTAVEALVQQGREAFDKLVAIRPAHLAGKGNTKPGREWNDANRGRLVFDHADELAMLEMLASLKECAGWSMVEGAETQVTLTGTAYGIAMQARPDWLRFGCGLEHTISLDLKTTKNLRDIATGYAVIKFGYHTQAAIVRQLLRANGYEDTSHYLVAVEKQPSYRAAIFELPHELLDRADDYLAKHAADLKRFMEENDWPRASREVLRIELPNWMRRGTSAVDNDNDAAADEHDAAD